MFNIVVLCLGCVKHYCLDMKPLLDVVKSVHACDDISYSEYSAEKDTHLRQCSRYIEKKALFPPSSSTTPPENARISDLCYLSRVYCDSTPHYLWQGLRCRSTVLKDEVCLMLPLHIYLTEIK